MYTEEVKIVNVIFSPYSVLYINSHYARAQYSAVQLSYRHARALACLRLRMRNTVTPSTCAREFHVDVGFCEDERGFEAVLICTTILGFSA